MIAFQTIGRGGTVKGSDGCEPVHRVNMGVAPGKLALAAAWPEPECQARRLLAIVLEGQPGEWRIGCRCPAGTLHCRGDPALRRVGKILEGDGMKQHARHAGSGCGADQLIDPVSGIRPVECRRGGAGTAAGGLDAAKPGGLSGGASF